MSVEIFGLKDSQDWALLRVAAPQDERNGVIGWMATELFNAPVPLDVVPIYGFTTEGSLILVEPVPGPAEESPPAQEEQTADPGVIDPAPQVGVPVIVPAPGAAAPAPGRGEVPYIMGGQAIPANPLQPLIGVNQKGVEETLLFSEESVVEIWSGLLGGPDGQWISAQAQLLWPGTGVYLTTQPDTEDPKALAVVRARIASLPALQRVQLTGAEDVAGFDFSGTPAGQGIPAAALLGSLDGDALSLLGSEGQLAQIGERGVRVEAVGSPERPEILIQNSDRVFNIQRFSWVQLQGEAMRFYAQPFRFLAGVARQPETGESAGTLWWIENSRISGDLWQLWRYDLDSNTVSLALQQTGQWLAAGGADDRLSERSLSPQLVGIIQDPEAEPGAVTFVLDTADSANRQLYTGIYRLTVGPFAENGQPSDARLERFEQVSSYRGPLTLSPDGQHMGFFAYDKETPSLTSGFIEPANRLYALELVGPGAGQALPVFSAVNRFEFLAPNLAWLDNQTMLVARSRFAQGEFLALDRFALVQAPIPTPDDAAPSPTTYLFPLGLRLHTYAPCMDQVESLVSVEFTEDGERFIVLMRWNGDEVPVPLAELPQGADRVHLCWQAPTADFVVSTP